MPKVAITWRMPAELLAIAKEHAESERRSLTNFVECALWEYCGVRGVRTNRAVPEPTADPMADEGAL